MRNWGSIGLAAGFTIGTIASAISLPAMAASERSAVLEEVVVTARKQEESAQDVPIAITALTQELENSSIRNLQDLNGYSPNLVFSSDGSRGGGGARHVRDGGTAARRRVMFHFRFNYHFTNQ